MPVRKLFWPVGYSDQGKWEVTEYYGYNSKAKQIYYQSTEPGSINRGIYSIALSGKDKKALAIEKGTNNATFSPDFSLFINQYSSVAKPPIYTLNNSKTGKITAAKAKTRFTEMPPKFVLFSLFVHIQVRKYLLAFVRQYRLYCL